MGWEGWEGWGETWGVWRRGGADGVDGVGGERLGVGGGGDPEGWVLGHGRCTVEHNGTLQSLTELKSINQCSVDISIPSSGGRPLQVDIRGSIENIMMYL